MHLKPTSCILISCILDSFNQNIYYWGFILQKDRVQSYYEEKHKEEFSSFRVKQEDIVPDIECGQYIRELKDSDEFLHGRLKPAGSNCRVIKARAFAFSARQRRCKVLNGRLRTSYYSIIPIHKCPFVKKNTITDTLTVELPRFEILFLQTL